MTGQSEKKYPVFWGAVVITDIVVGDGTFALSADLAGAWFFWGAFVLTITRFSMLHSGLLLSKVNLNCPVRPSFNTIIKDLIGNTWNIISGITVVFTLYTLTHAYISANSAIISETTSVNLDCHTNPRIVGICTAIFAISVLWISSLAASRITSLFLGLKIISFVIVFGSFFFRVDRSILRDSASTTVGTSYFPYTFMVSPMCPASFGFHGNIPNPVIYYGKRKGRLIKSVVFGLLLALVIYPFWLYCMMGDILRESLEAIIPSGDNIDPLVKSFLGTKQHGIIELCLLVFSNLAVASPFFGVTLELFDYPADLFEIDNSHTERFKTVPLTFLPLALLYLIFPNGFVYRIDGTGLCATIWAVIIPAILIIKVRKKFPNQIFTVWDDNPIPAIIILFDIIVVLYWFSNVLNVLSKLG